MIKFFKILIFLLTVTQVNAQELDATITINSDKISGSNKQVYQTLERTLIEFINQKKWTNRKFKAQEKIKCAFTLTILEQSSSTNFKGNIQIQSSRPVYNSTYLTPIFNFKDDDFSFRYTEFETLQYNPNNFDSNLVSVIAFYVYTILGMDGDSFTRNGGTEYFKDAENVMNQAQQGGFAGWSRTTSGATRYKLINDILSNSFIDFRTAMFIFNRQGLDTFHKDKEESKENIATAISKIKNIYNRRPNALLVRTFMDSKADEIVSIFSDGPRYDTSKLVDDLNRMSPVNSTKWNKIK
ncbi:MAG: DUF4835 domain-containing protein [Lutibacter sp.]|nr:MAG: DUF4835 domain-containing protein [Lutibacter sp.]